MVLDSPPPYDAKYGQRWLEVTWARSTEWRGVRVDEFLELMHANRYMFKYWIALTPEHSFEDYARFRFTPEYLCLHDGLSGLEALNGSGERYILRRKRLRRYEFDSSRTPFRRTSRIEGWAPAFDEDASPIHESGFR